MISRLLAAISLVSLLCQFAFSQVEEGHIDFDINADVIQDGKIHVAYEWLRPYEFLQKKMNAIDHIGISSIRPGNNQLIASKVALISNQAFDDLTYDKMNNAEYISNMLGSVAITQISASSWRITNRVRAYGFPFKVSFDLQFKEISANILSSQVVSYLRNESSVIKNAARERIFLLDMTNFTQLMYRNYSFVYLKELSNHETLIISAIVAAIDIKKANSYFNYPPISRTENTMMDNMRRQILHMANEIQN